MIPEGREVTAKKEITMITLFFDPIQLVLSVVNDLYPDIEAEVILVDEIPGDEEAVGGTLFPDDGGTPQILMTDIPLSGFVEVLAHECAHVVCGDAEEHGEKWEAVSQEIYVEYCKRVEALAGADENGSTKDEKGS